ncbi:MAG: type transporter [Pseudonocardiales bacterium]|nr:type transporter [Pseudonocardiales bacterium]
MRLAGPETGFITGTGQSIRDIWAYRELLVLLTRRELKSRYKDSALGFVWSLIRPLSQLLIYYIALGKFLGAERAIPNYAVFVYTGLTVWQLYSEIVSSGTGSIVSNGGLVKKIYLPREVFPLSMVGAALFNFLIQIVILICACFAVGKPPVGRDLLYVPLALLVLLLFAIAAAFLLAALNVYLRDIQYLVEVGLMVLFWTAPTVYSWEQVHKVLGDGILGQIYDLNPLSNIVLAFQKAFWIAGDGQPGPPHIWLNLVILTFVGVFLLWFCQRVFSRLQNNFAQEL